jgi:hypothetical protein
MLQHSVDAYPDGVFNVHLPGETHVAIAEANDVVVDSFITSLLHL